MKWMFFGMDRANALELRLETRPQHLEYLKSCQDKVVYAGPLTQDDGKTPLGSLVILECDTRDEAQALCDGDPYAKVGLFANTNLLPWNQVIG